MRILHEISAWLLSTLGVVHTAMTPVFHSTFTLDALWFASAGLMMIFAGFLNIAMSRDIVRDRLIRSLCFAANLLVLVFGVLLVMLDQGPQVIFGLALIILMTVTAFKVSRPRSASTGRQ